MADTIIELEEEEPGMKYQATESELRGEETELWMGSESNIESKSESDYIDKSGM